jgi:2,4-dienoyl-CoA reductase-like NADH-dependent reductase (Old Yellow Enzyme family)/thioredoxin reductase
LSLWDPVRIAGLGLRNRAVMPAMGTGYASDKGEATDRLTAYLKKRAEGGAGLIITEVAAIHPLGKGFASELGAYDDSFLPSLRRLAASIKDGGAAAALQLHHAGRETFAFVIGEQPVGASALASRTLGQIPRELSRREVEELIGSYAGAAARAREAGFDAVEVHGAHGYLINQFLSPYSNKREDEYGGDAEGRFRFAREIVRAIKERAGHDFPVLFRFSSTEAVEGGYDLEDILPLLPLLQEDGVDALHVSCGVYDSPGNPTCPGLHYPYGINVERAARVKEVVDVPVIVVGKIRDPRMADEIIGDGSADLIAFGRQHLADPDFLAKAQEGKYGDIRFCLYCNQGCIERLMFELKPATCNINPECGSEWIERKGEARKGPFLVVGSGAAGLQAAITLSEAGAVVKVVERESSPGGQLRAASQPPGKEAFGAWYEWAVARLDSLGITVALGEEAGEESFRDTTWAGAIIATGSRPIRPAVPGSELALNLDARQVLMGREQAGERVIIVGAGAVGMETADYLIERGAQVTVVEEKEASPVLILTSHGYFLHKRLREAGELLLGSRIVEVNQDGALMERQGKTLQINADSVVWAAGARAENELMQAASRAGVEARAVGDAKEPRRLLEAVHEGAGAAEWLLYGD